jgi:hypothetical protein
MANSSLTAIRTKIRRLTRSQSSSQVSDAEINEYVNTFIQYDLPSELRLIDNKKTFKFYTRPNQDKYETLNLVPGPGVDPLSQYKQIETATFGPVYVGGYRVSFSQSKEEFYARWPFFNQQLQIATGDGVTTNFTGTLANIPVLPNNVVFSSIDTSGLQLVLQDTPVLTLLGVPTNDGNLQVPAIDPAVFIIDVANTINYVTGVYNITFATAPAAGQPVYILAYPYVATRPTSMLFFDNTFFLRPVPNIPYPVEIEVYIRPTELLANNDTPDLEQWWQYIAYGAAIKLLQDKSDTDTVQQIFPEFKRQELMVLRRTLVQQGEDRAATIYSQQTSLSGAPWGWWNGFGN